MTAPVASDTSATLHAAHGCIEACRRCAALVQAISPEGAPDRQASYARLGRHLRHCLDHFLCLLFGADPGVVNYDARARDERLERDPAYFLHRLGEVVEKLSSLDAAACRCPVEVRQEASPGGASLGVQSNLERELVFLSGHTIHHIAIMTLLAEAQGMPVPRDLGVAFSTATHLQRTEREAGVG